MATSNTLLPIKSFSSSDSEFNDDSDVEELDDDVSRLSQWASNSQRQFATDDVKSDALVNKRRDSDSLDNLTEIKFDDSGDEYENGHTITPKSSGKSGYTTISTSASVVSDASPALSGIGAGGGSRNARRKNRLSASTSQSISNAKNRIRRTLTKEKFGNNSYRSINNTTHPLLGESSSSRNVTSIPDNNIAKPSNVDDIANQYMFSANKAVVTPSQDATPEDEAYDKILADSDYILNSNRSTGGVEEKSQAYSYEEDANDFISSENKTSTKNKVKDWVKDKTSRGRKDSPAGLDMIRFSSDHNEFVPDDDESGNEDGMYSKKNSSSKVIELGNGYMYEDSSNRDRKMAILFTLALSLLGILTISLLSKYTPWRHKAVEWTMGDDMHFANDDHLGSIVDDGVPYFPEDTQFNDDTDHNIVTETPPKTKAPSFMSASAPSPSYGNPVPSDGSVSPLTRNDVLEIISSVTPKDLIMQEGSIQNMASEWLVENDPLINTENFRLKDERVIQRYVLASMYYSLDGDSWVEKQGWLTEVHECDWDGINCNINEEDLSPGDVDGISVSAVTGIDLTGRNLSGVIPLEIGYLNELKSIWLFDNRIRGQIPNSILRLERLTELYLDDNQISGSIPQDIGLLKNLESLDLSGNNLKGKIPNGIGNMESMTDLRLSKNQLTGEFPIEILDLKKIRTLLLDHNQIEGDIPRLVGRLKNLQILRLSRNEFYGRIPEEIGFLTALRELHLDFNVLSGTIPKSLGKLENLRELFLTENDFVGEIPTNLGELEMLETLRLDYNKLEGNIPSEIGSLENLRSLYLGATGVEGPIPDELKNLKSLSKLYLEKNKISSTIPVWLGELMNLEELNLSQNKFYGSIPGQLSKLVSLGKYIHPFIKLRELLIVSKYLTLILSLHFTVKLELTDNSLSGDVPTLMCGLEYLDTINVDCSSVNCDCCASCPGNRT